MVGIYIWLNISLFWKIRPLVSLTQQRCPSLSPPAGRHSLSFYILKNALR